MNFFQWDENFVTGMSEVDDQHHHLVDLSNEFGTLVSRDVVNPADLEKIFVELVSYTYYHFETEEKLMQLSGVDRRHVVHHEQEHLGFLQEVSLMHQSMLGAKDATGRQLFDFLMNWLVYHIMGSDMSLARQIAAIQKGLPAADAYLAEERAVDKATGLLLRSLSNLFQQVTVRNKELFELNQTLEVRVAERTMDLSEANRKLGELALTDVLTGLSNRRHALQLLEGLWEESEKKSLPLACMLIDADGFKQINDTYGHDAGDEVLREIAKQLKYVVRNDDLVCRLGGDEFLIICPKTNLVGALNVADQTQGKIAELTVQAGDGCWPGSISVGVAEKTVSMQRPEDLLKAADLGVYAAKNAGRNCVKTGSDQLLFPLML
jgi:diguanylate cyclase (GGDEF)-like protein/hemerythrin-like metal-binding protein